MVGFRHLRFGLLCMLAMGPLCGALQPASGVHVYLREKTDAIRPGDEAVEIAQIAGQSEPSADKAVIRFGPRSAWSASTSTGRSLGGTWSGAVDLSAGTATGSWTLKDSAGRTVLRGTWSASKSAQEWQGSWRALVAGQTGERSGTWSSEVQLPPDASLASLFEESVHQIISGTWQYAGQSGGWSIRASR